MSEIPTDPTASASGPVKAATMDMLRSVLMGAGTPLLARGLVNGDQLGAIIGGLLAIASAVWSYAAAHSGGPSLLARVLALAASGTRPRAWDADAAALGAALLPILESLVDRQIRSRAGVLSGPLDTAANAALRTAETKAVAAVELPQS
ncbi:MAG TPA: hypothetical protein VK801_02665 [Caulobacteraceae bacterium]|jgi:hypothetical protein|nr:hypothetical protein [Caulobacteraceae bacterium]